MPLDVAAMLDFYASPVGRLVGEEIGGALVALHRPGPSDRIAGFGFATPYLPLWRGAAERVIALAPAAQGVAFWPEKGRGLVALAEEERLPLPDGSLDGLLLVHALEASRHPAKLLAEALRVLVASGRLVVVVPNRRGPWAISDASPFGYGRPYSAGQTTRLLAEGGFTVETMRPVLHAPPLLARKAPAVFRMTGRAGARLWPALGGVLVAVAVPGEAEIAPIRLRQRPEQIVLDGLAARPGLAGRAAPASPRSRS